MVFRVLAVVAVATGAACSGAPGETIGTGSSASTFANDQPAYDYFVGKGLTPFQAAGIVGNLDQESGVDPTSVESGGGPGRGIAQWSVGGRWDTDTNDNATSYAQQQGLALLSLQLQLDFIWYELTTFPSYGLAALRATTNVTDATVAFETDFEGCGTCDQSQRVAYAENVLGAFGMTDASAPLDAGGGEDAATPCTVSATGASGVCLDTSVCASLGGHESTPGYCPGPDNIQCCTANADDAGMTKTTDAGVVHHGDGGSPASSGDAGKGKVLEGGAPSSGEEDASVAEHGIPMGASSPGGGGGCSAAPSGSGGWWSWWLAPLAWVPIRRRRRAPSV